MLTTVLQSVATLMVGVDCLWFAHGALAVCFCERLFLSVYIYSNAYWTIKLSKRLVMGISVLFSEPAHSTWLFVFITSDF